MESANTNNPGGEKLSYAEVLRGCPGKSATRKSAVKVSDIWVDKFSDIAIQGPEQSSPPVGITCESPHSEITREDLVLNDLESSEPSHSQSTDQDPEEIMVHAISRGSSPRTTARPCARNSSCSLMSTLSLPDLSSLQIKKTRADTDLNTVPTWADVTTTMSSKNDETTQQDSKISGTEGEYMDEKAPECRRLVPEESRDKDRALDEECLEAAEKEETGNLDDQVEEVIARVIENQQRKVEQEKQAMMRVLAKGDAM